MFRCNHIYTDWGFIEEESTSEKNHITWSKTTIKHKWYKDWDLAQQIVQYAYEYSSGDMDFIYLLECESWMNPLNKWDSGKAYWICQMNSNYHSIPQQYYDDWKFQVEYCYEKYKGWTKFYWPSRKTKATNYMRCSDYVKDRFVLDE